ncbi:hypothetical protein C4585_01135 [Candidatus Parcubacteria bacterium]|nr:MAG: hypothetical protein C4585_01135 [Candidatus Parcubacteria bacterium]
MQGDPTLGASFTSIGQFVGDAFFTWIPRVVASVMRSAEETISTTTPVLGPLNDPLSTEQLPTFLENVATPSVYDSMVQGWYLYVLFGILISLPFFAIAIYCLVRVYLLRRHEAQVFAAAAHTVEARDIPRTQLRWGRVLEQARGNSEHAWRLAILEADIMLAELLDLQGYKGETMADKMKQVNRANFNSIDAAWEAHKVRNRIAHDGSAHDLTQREARRVIGLYEKVFKEFKFIS